MKKLLLLAPMAGLTHAAFRELVASYGKPDFFFTEMLNVRAIVYQNPEKDPYLITAEKDKPLIAQLAGKDPALFRKAVKHLEKLNLFAGYDLNFGCARGAIQRYGWGVSLMKKPSLCAEIVAAVKEVTTKPISAKIRSGFEHNPDKLLHFAQTIVAAGIEFITLHPRTAEEGFKRPARWEEIKLLVENLSIPIIGNGDIFSPEDAQKLFETTGCQGVMIGRAALLRPWIFRDIKKFFQNKEIINPPSPTDAPSKHWSLIEKLLPKKLQEKRFELWLFWYLQNFPFGLHYFRQVKKEKNLEKKLNLLKELLTAEKIKPYPAKPYLLR
ncbi:dihydrouridine synthase DuS [Thermodesulfatator indicus DSM 15286]|uniref:tRNA-dihydrouridine synthase n=1 Tax=Thermodesulfatator indicus (strain DSM 15286 / JCM 11887 / CIR29812) TaxID=667014 RepID=F8AAJ6_THEID|nr:tRNA-dihydrouridine synthase family protein [Thermodesulfatator indicus]AEH45419.1 dihydrouridine synthase DuS [Thermodesulfatator indicus DSM 15286]